MENLLSRTDTAVISRDELWNLAYSTIKDLEFEGGIRASGEEDRFGCVFGRDSLITSLKLLRAYRKNEDSYLLEVVKKILTNLASLQGHEENIESGEEPGKCIHEYRPDHYESLTVFSENPWYVYPEGALKNYDSVDATSLFLITAYRYWQVSGDTAFLAEHLGNIFSAIDWILKRGDSNGDGFIDYKINKRRFGGLYVQSWMDSKESLFDEDGKEIFFPIAPVEVESYTYLALKLWGRHFSDEKIIGAAQNLKKLFNEKFVIEHSDKIIFPYAIDGKGRALTSLRSSIGHTLWASLKPELDDGDDSILEKEFIPELVYQIMAPEIFEDGAGIRTLSRNSSNFNFDSYHNGSIWPHDNSMIAEGLENFGYFAEAEKIRSAFINGINHFGTPLELYAHDGNFREYSGGASRRQAWSAASLLADLT